MIYHVMIYSGVSIRLLSTVALLLPLSLSEQPTFEAASIKLHNPQSGFTKGRILPGGGIEARGMTAEDLLTYAYGILPNMISGLPKWAKETSFDLVAKAPHDTPPATLRLMLQALLAERFKIRSHNEDRPQPAYVLTVDKRGHKLQPAAGTQSSCSWIELPSSVTRRQCQNMTMAELVPRPHSAALPEGPTIFDAIEQLGLKLEPRKVPLPVLVIDAFGPLTEN